MNPEETTFVIYKRRKGRYKIWNLKILSYKIQIQTWTQHEYILIEEREQGRRKTGWHFIAWLALKLEQGQSSLPTSPGDKRID